MVAGCRVVRPTGRWAGRASVPPRPATTPGLTTGAGGRSDGSPGAGHRSRGGGRGRAGVPSVGTSRGRSTSRPSSGAGSMYVSPRRSPKCSRRPPGRPPPRRPRRPRRPARRRQPAVRRPQPVAVVDDQVRVPATAPLNVTDARGGRPHRRARRHAVLQPPVARAPRARRLPERVDDRRRHRRHRHPPAGRRRHAPEHGSDQQRRPRARLDLHVVGSRRPPVGEGRDGLGRGRRRQATPAADRRARRCSTDLVCICGTRLSLTPSTRLIWASVSPSS